MSQKASNHEGHEGHKGKEKLFFVLFVSFVVPFFSEPFATPSCEWVKLLSHHRSLPPEKTLSGLRYYGQREAVPQIPV